MSTANTMIKKVYTSLTLSFLTITGVLTSCTKDTAQMRMYPSKNLGEEALAQNQEIDLPKSSEEKETNGPAFAIVLLHGLNTNINELQYLAEKIQNEFNDLALIIQPTCREGIASINQHIHNQTEKVFQYIQSEITAHNKAPNALSLIIIGYSAGGVVACVLGKTYKEQLNIRGIATLNAPLRGVDIFKDTYSKVRNFMSKAEVQKGLEYIVYPNSVRWIEIKTKLRASGIELLRWLPIAHGAKDLLPDSTSINGVAKFVRDTAHDIPYLIIGSHLNDFKKLFNTKQNLEDSNATAAIERFNDAYSEFITGEKDKAHDTLISLLSQLCRGKSFDNLTLVGTDDPITIDMPGQPNIKTRIYKDKIHGQKLIAIGNGLPVDSSIQELPVLSSNQILDDLIEFIKQVK